MFRQLGEQQKRRHPSPLSPRRVVNYREAVVRCRTGCAIWPNLQQEDLHQTVLSHARIKISCTATLSTCRERLPVYNYRTIGEESPWKVPTPNAWFIPECVNIQHFSAMLLFHSRKSNILYLNRQNWPFHSAFMRLAVYARAHFGDPERARNGSHELGINSKGPFNIRIIL